MAEVYFVDDDDPRIDHARLDAIAAFDRAALFAAGAPVIDLRDHDHGNDAWAESAEELLEEANACQHLINHFLVPQTHRPFFHLIRFTVLTQQASFLREIEAARQARDVRMLADAVGRFNKYICDLAGVRGTVNG